MIGREVVESLDGIYPRIRTHLSHRGPFQLLIATILSAQCTDAQVNRITPLLFERFPDPSRMSEAKITELERLVKPTGFFHVKANRIREVSRRITTSFQGRVPDTMDELLTLGGVGRKTANIVLSAGFGKIDGIAVDTHVFRLSRRIGLSNSNTPEKVEQDLMRLTPKEVWPRLSMLLILHGRNVCFARKPMCEKCVLSSKCAYYKDKILQKKNKRP